MTILLIITAIAIVCSFFKDLGRDQKRAENVPKLITILAKHTNTGKYCSLSSAKGTLVKWLGHDSGCLGMAVAAILGSISLIPGFIAFPLGWILLKSGVSYQVIAVFITTLMMVGILTLFCNRFAEQRRPPSYFGGSSNSKSYCKMRDYSRRRRNYC